MTFKNAFAPPAGKPAYRCPCCHFVTLRERGGYEICPVCFWEDDGQDDHDAKEVRGGPNAQLSLAAARVNFLSYGASDPKDVDHVRPPTPQELMNRRTALEDGVALA
jgi:Cysteine-rich CPCC